MLTVLLQWLPLIVSLLAILFAWFMIRRERLARQALESKFAATELVLKNARQQNESMQKQFQELRAGTMGMGQKLAEMDHQLESLAERQGELAMQDPDGRLYSRASKMVELGADVNELMEECDLPKAEAELLLRLQQMHQSRRR
ncbi:DUF2802 domain-containing protein [Photobacterium ganghwense]|uniref:DNA repair protein n=1 Tax=Photobacterium ganghwense TaxID=320778 RepID=A0A0J1K9H7_9GAMM|nr:DUF2802 domain-containing protein [Photobacterium ganghwense]KLV10982.1 DNA repair protein [Photobacterium ganghwense]MBV1840682.1 DUF2802 domain-containing protein [Photobacterium ganghwense]PSU11244.1 DUF2802 domain-containing protein [Photobacterium ganghwense]QSV15657.1 DUF2802 domain-containing protein [Photobacterium ganghwense]